MPDLLVIPSRFCGPPGSANGGYTAGLAAAFVTGTSGMVEAVEVTLRRPPPLDEPLEVTRGNQLVLLRDGDAVVAEAAAVGLDLDARPAVGVATARAAASSSPLLLDPSAHPFPSCFVCGPARAEGDGLRLLPGRVAGTDVFAAAWTPAAEFDAGDGRARPEIVWAALDCPSSFTMYLEEDPLPGPYVLGRMTARIAGAPRVDETCVVQAWRREVDGRKLHAASALYDRGGAVLAVAHATWIRIA